MIENLNEDELTDIQETINELIDNYLEENGIYIFNPDFNDEMNQTISEIIYHDFQYIFENESTEDSELYDSIEEFVDKSIENYFVYSRIPKRSNSITFEDDNEKVEILKHKIAFLKEQEQPEQKTKEWYQFRYNLITASNLWKVFGTESQVNSLIYEKCKPLQEISHDSLQSGPLFWGIKYEPVTVMIYEDMFNTKVDDFGCIKHGKYPFIGASPDGINVDETNIRFGRMIEIKNIYNREITGIPKKEYWIQMQLQMEVCKLETCDFVETRIKEFDDMEEYLDKREEYEYNGIVLEFLPKFKPCDISSNEQVLNNNKKKLFHMILDNSKSKNEIEEIINKAREDNENFYLLGVSYWYLDEFSCVLVKRNELWFKKSLSEIENVWNIIEKERIDGYEHRASKKRRPSIDKTEKVGCLIELNEDSM
jgi:putative phage-type endonuclease